MAFLRIKTTDSELPRDFILSQRSTSIGRRSDNDIVIDNSSVSKCHARLNSEVGYFLTDLRSSNGTFINGKKILHAKLTNEDEINFAEISAIFFE